MVETVVFLLIGAVLAVAAALALIRVVRGPSVLDRAIATEVLVAVLIVALGVEAAIDRDTTTLPAIISLSLVAFTSSAAVALFVARDRDDERAGQASRPGRPGVGPAGVEADPQPGEPREPAATHTDDRDHGGRR